MSSLLGGDFLMVNFGAHTCKSHHLKYITELQCASVSSFVIWQQWYLLHKQLFKYHNKEAT